jgi:DNA-binding transcriptional regulator YhcF (GntR family)
MTAGEQGLPKYARVAAAVRGQIAAGALLPGQPAPSGAALSRLTGFSTLTCRRALRVLIEDGLLTPGPSRNARPRVAGAARQPAERDLAAATRALSAGLAARRRAHGLTQPELAALTGVSVTLVGHAETGRLWQSRRFWERADAILDAAGALLRLHDAYRAAVAAAGQTARTEGRQAALAEVAARPLAGEGDDQERSERLGLSHQPVALPAGLATPTCVMIVWGDGSVTTVHPPRAALGKCAPGTVVPGRAEHPA